MSSSDGVASMKRKLAGVKAMLGNALYFGDSSDYRDALGDSYALLGGDPRNPTFTEREPVVPDTSSDDLYGEIKERAAKRWRVGSLIFWREVASACKGLIGAIAKSKGELAYMVAMLRRDADKAKFTIKALAFAMTRLHACDACSGDHAGGCVANCVNYSTWTPDDKPPAGEEAKEAWLKELCVCGHERCVHGHEDATGLESVCKDISCNCEAFLKAKTK